MKLPLGLDRVPLAEVEEQIDKERRLVDYDTAEYTAELFADKYLGGDIYIPEYQREDMWDTPKKSRFIESLLLALPIPFVFLSENDDGRMEVVDGSQRLRAICDFLADRFCLVDIETLDTAVGYRFSELPQPQQRKLRNRPIRAIILSSKTDDTTKFDVFHRLNTYGKTLTDAEIRKGAFPGPFYSLVLDVAKTGLFKDLCPLSAKKVAGGEREELALRFFIYSEHYLEFKHDVNRFLNGFIKKLNKAPDLDIATLRHRFMTTMRFIQDRFPYGVRKASDSKEVPRVRFEAISIGSYLALEARPTLQPPINSFNWLDSDDFEKLTRTDASNSSTKLRNRIEFVRDRLLEHN